MSGQNPDPKGASNLHASSLDVHAYACDGIVVASIRCRNGFKLVRSIQGVEALGGTLYGRLHRAGVLNQAASAKVGEEVLWLARPWDPRCRPEERTVWIVGCEPAPNSAWVELHREGATVTTHRSTLFRWPTPAEVEIRKGKLRNMQE